MKQTLSDRLKRLKKGSCPIHGIFMSQIDRPAYNKNFIEFVPVGCPRKDCGITARAYGLNGPCEIDEKWIHVLDDAEILFMKTK